MVGQDAEAASISTVKDRLSWKEICVRYPEQWVVLIDVEHEAGEEDGGEIVSAVVLGHSKKSGDCLRATRPLRPPGTDCAHLYTGKMVAPLVPVRFFL